MLPLARCLVAASIAAVAAGCSSLHRAPEFTRSSFHWFTNFEAFARSESAGAVTLLSPRIDAGRWDELIVSWNGSCPPQAHMVVEARAFDGSRWTRFYTMGIWAEDDSRESVRRQRDSDAVVKTDTLVTKPMAAAQVRVRLTGSGAAQPVLKFLGLSFLDSKAPLAQPTRTNHLAWGRTLDVPQRSQLGYKGASGWCSPTSVSMLLAYWSRQLNRAELDLPVPVVAAGVYDPNWGGTGNWPFNMAFAGKFDGMRGFVTRFDELAQVEDCIAAGVPVALSVSFDLLNGREKDLGNGHLVLAIGFTDRGDVVVNDPWPNPKRENSVRKIFPRDRVLKAWQRSDRTVYVVCPESVDLTAFVTDSR